MEKKLSIITINHNNAPGLRKTMESVFSQTSNNFEYIVIDGGSTDGSKEIILEFAKQHFNKSINRPFTWISETDKGLYHAMNKGIRIASGEYCQFLNSGDWLVSVDVTSRMLDKLPESSIVYGNMIKQLPNGKILYNKEIPAMSFLTFYTGTLNHSPSYIKRSLFKKYGMYDENLKIISDWKFFLIAIALNNEKVIYQDVDVTCFDMKGISNLNSELDKKERKLVLEQLIPANILADYNHYFDLILKMKRINRYSLTRWLVWLLERILFKLEKWETHLKNEHIIY